MKISNEKLNNALEVMACFVKTAEQKNMLHAASLNHPLGRGKPKCILLSNALVAANSVDALDRTIAFHNAKRTIALAHKEANTRNL